MRNTQIFNIAKIIAIFEPAVSKHQKYVLGSLVAILARPLVSLCSFQLDPTPSDRRTLPALHLVSTGLGDRN